MTGRVLPPPGLDTLPFGNGSATAFDGVASGATFLARLPERPSVIDAVGPKARFHVRLHSVPLPTLTLVAGSSAPKVVDHESRRAAVVIPFGLCGAVIRSGRQEHRWLRRDRRPSRGPRGGDADLAF